MRVRERLSWFLLAALGLFVVASFANAVSGGSLEPPGPVGSTMKTLDDIPGSWHRRLSTTGADPCSTARFQCVMDDEAVLDRETGLVWQRVPGTTVHSWSAAVGECYKFAVTGGRYGWRLPTVEETSSLIEVATNTLPANHPFTASGFYWTATVSDPVNGNPQSYALGVNPEFLTAVPFNQSQLFPYWCVRGGSTGS